MCYDVKATLQTQLKYAKKYTPELVPEIEAKLAPLLEKTELNWQHVSGFVHPHLLIYTQQNNWNPQIAQWGLIPEWAKDEAQAKSIQNKTLNARSETIFEKPSFKLAAESKRCVIAIDGFYEHHHFAGKTFPYFFYNDNGNPLTLAGLWSDWRNPTSGISQKTFSIVTTRGNSTFQEIHNNPKLNEPRMPVILNDNQVESWLNPTISQQELGLLFEPKAHPNLKHHTVAKLKGKLANKDKMNAAKHYRYAALEEIQGNLFD